MLKLPLPGTARRRVGVLCTALVIAAGATAAWAAQPGAIAQPQSNAVESERPATATYQGQSETTPSEVTVRSASPPAYPREAREARQQGTVILRVLVGIRGESREVIVETSSGAETLDAAAVAAARQWKFNPGITDGKPSEGAILVPVTFSLNAGGGGTAQPRG